MTNPRDRAVAPAPSSRESGDASTARQVASGPVLIQFTRNVTVDLDTGAIYIHLREGTRDHTEELVADTVMVDYSADGMALGVEVLA